MEVVKRVNPKSSHHKEKIFFLIFFFFLYYKRWWILTKLIVVNTSQYVSQTLYFTLLMYIMLYVNYISIKLNKKKKTQNKQVKTRS